MGSAHPWLQEPMVQVISPGPPKAQTRGRVKGECGHPVTVDAAHVRLQGPIPSDNGHPLGSFLQSQAEYTNSRKPPAQICIVQRCWNRCPFRIPTEIQSIARASSARSGQAAQAGHHRPPPLGSVGTRRLRDFGGRACLAVSRTRVGGGSQAHLIRIQWTYNFKISQTKCFMPAQEDECAVAL